MARLTAKANEDKPLLGIVLMLGAFLGFSCIDTGAKWLGILGLHALQLSFMRYAGHFLISASLISKGGWEPSRFGTDNIFWVLLRGVLLMASTVFNFVAVQYLPLTLTATILFSAPIIICILSWPLLGERVGLWRWSAIFIGFIGILVAIRPFDESFHWAAILSLLGATCFSFYSILTRKLAGVVSSEILQFYSGAVGTVLLLPLAIWTWQNPETNYQWLILFSLGLFGWFGHELLTRAHGYAPASTLSPFGYVFIIYLTVWSYVVFEHLPDRWTIAGAMIIVLAGMVIWFRESHVHKQAAKQSFGQP